MMLAISSPISGTVIILFVFQPARCIYKYVPLRPVINAKAIETATRPLLEDYIWAEKTRFVLQLLKDEKGRLYFARPRYFGKTILLRTLQAVFQGRRDIFKGTDIYDDPNYQWEDFPVMYFELSVNSPEAVIEEELKSFKKREGIGTIPKACLYLSDNSSAESIEELVMLPPDGSSAAEPEIPPALRQFQQILCAVKENDPLKRSTVVLIDEYDHFILSNLRHQAVLTQTTKLLTRFFEYIESSAQWIHFAFVTGITRRSFDTVIGDHFKDISDDPSYGELAGITKDELRKYFQPRINKLAKIRKVSTKEIENELNDWYEGYAFTPNVECLYNPKSIVRYFHTGVANWIQATRSTVLWHHLRRRPEAFRSVRTGVRSDLRFENDSVIFGEAETVLYEVGYFTITKTDHGHPKPFVLGFANDEVRYAFFEDVVQAATKKAEGALPETAEMKEAIEKSIPDFNTFITVAAAGIHRLCFQLADLKSYRALLWVLMATCDLERLERPKTKIKDVEMDIMGQTASTHFFLRLEYEQEGSDWGNRSALHSLVRDKKNVLSVTVNFQRLPSVADEATSPPGKENFADNVVSGWKGELRSSNGSLIRMYSKQDSNWLKTWMNYAARNQDE